MRVAIAVAGVMALLSAVPAGALEFSHDGRLRTAELVVPAAAEGPLATLFVLHGGRGGGARVRALTGLDRLARETGFVAVFPSAIGGNWDDGRAAPAIRARHGGQAIDDVGYLAALARRLIARGTTDPARLFVMGLSNGGMMTLRLACESADLFRAFVAVIASLPAALAARCRPARPVPVMLMNGTADRLVPWAGGRVAPMWPADRGQVLSTPATLAFWRRVDRCGDTATEQDRGAVGGAVRLTVTAWRDCAPGAAVVLYRFAGMGHRWPGPGANRAGATAQDFAAGEAILRFLALR